MLNRGVFTLFNWTLRRDVRLLRTHVLRGIFAGLMLLVIFFAWASTLTVGAAGLNLFRAICWLNVIVSTLAAISYFATTVTEESESGNIGLLKLAGMGSFSILLAKSTSRLIGALMFLVVQFPFTLLAITLGGVTLLQIVTCYVALGAHLILVANLALFFSVYCQSSGRAAVWTAVVLAAFFLSVLVASFVEPVLTPGNPGWASAWADTHSDLSVVDRIDAALRPAFAGPVVSKQVTGSVVSAVVLYLLACVGFERSTLRQGVPQRAALARGRRSLGRTFGVSRVWKSAIAWKEFNFLTGGRVMWVARVVVFSAISALVLFYAEPGMSDDRAMVSQILAVGALGFTAIELVVFSSRIVFDEMRWQTLPLLLILPIRPQQVVTQKVLGCLLALLPGVCWLFFALWLHPTSLVGSTAAGSVAYGLVNFALLLHLTVLLSIFVKWAALPLAVCAVFLFNLCCPVMSIGLVISDALGGADGVLLLGISLVTYWILLLLPLQVEIVSRVEESGGGDFG